MSENQSRDLGGTDGIDIKEVFRAIWTGKLLILSVTTIFAAVAVFYALSLPNLYKSEALLAPVSESSSLKLPAQLGGLAALAGVNVGAGGSDKTALALEILKSREFISRFIEKYDLFVPIMASSDWERASNTLVLDVDIFDKNTNEWVRKVAPPFEAKPSLQETYKRFIKLFSVSQDSNSGMVNISVTHFSPYLAKEWVNLLVEEINNDMRGRELAEAQNSIEYLNEQLTITSIADSRKMLFSLIEEQSKTVMLANVRTEYVLKTVDPAIVPEVKAKPARALICIIAVLLGLALSTFFVLVSYFYKKN